MQPDDRVPSVDPAAGHHPAEAEPESSGLAQPADADSDDLVDEAYDDEPDRRPPLFPAGSLAIAGLVLAALTLMSAATDLLVVLPFVNGPTSRDQGMVLAVGYVVVAGVAALLGALGALSAQVDGESARSWRVEVGRAAVVVGLLSLLIHTSAFFTLLAQSASTGLPGGG